MLKKTNKKKCTKISGNLMFLPVKNFAHDNFFYKITIKKLRKFAIFHVFCKTVRKIVGKPLFWPNFYCTKSDWRWVLMPNNVNL